MNTDIYIILCLFLPSITLAQSTPPAFKGDNSFSSYVNNELNKRSGKLTGICNKVLGSIQLKLNKRGHIKEVLITGDMPELLRPQLREIALNTDKLWNPMKVNGKPTKSAPVIMLINIHIANGCEKLYNDAFYLNEKRYDFYKSLTTAFSGTALPTNCILVDPLLFVSDYGYAEIKLNNDK